MPKNESYCIFDTQFWIEEEPRDNPVRWRWVAARYWGGHFVSPWYAMDIMPSLKLFKKFIAGEAGLNQS